MTRAQFDSKYASGCDEFNAQSNADEINDLVFAAVSNCDADDAFTWQHVKAAYDKFND